PEAVYFRTVYVRKVEYGFNVRWNQPAFDKYVWLRGFRLWDQHWTYVSYRHQHRELGTGRRQSDEHRKNKRQLQELGRLRIECDSAGRERHRHHGDRRIPARRRRRVARGAAQWTNAFRRRRHQLDQGKASVRVGRRYLSAAA